MHLKIPPPIIFLTALGLLYAGSWLLPQARLTPPGREWLAGLLALFGALLGGQAVLAFIKAKTTVHPMKPEETSTVVTSGFYRISRNPMYLGLACLLMAFAIYSGTLTAIAIVPGFLWYMTEYQIKPEEERLAEKFEEAYIDYMNRVRRWI